MLEEEPEKDLTEEDFDMVTDIADQIHDLLDTVECDRFIEMCGVCSALAKCLVINSKISSKAMDSMFDIVRAMTKDHIQWLKDGGVEIEESKQPDAKPLDFDITPWKNRFWGSN